MRLLIALVLCSPMLAAATVCGESTFPYKTTVAADDVYVRSGPGQNYYPTDKLKRGQEIEVYRHDPGGWCAIRPVEGSFAWVSGRHLKPTEDNLAVVTQENVSARVGSRFSELRDVVQVRLHKGEKVEVLEGPPQNGRGDGWYKIAPPAGEFRWVAAKYLDADYPRDGLRKTPPEKHAHRHDRNVDRQDGRASDSDAPLIPSAALGGPRPGDPADDARNARLLRPRALTPEEFDAELGRIELELSVMVIENPAVWNFDTMRQRADMLLDQAQTAVERGRARVLANKIARFDDIKQRQDAVLAMRDETDRNSRIYAKLRPREDGRDVAGDIDDRFDGVGQLTQVVSPKAGAPRYALVDKAGDVRCYVTPAPGVHMQNYVGRRVGLTGARGYMPEQRASHIMARHVTPLDGPLVR
jgi:SH3-like domain-containing protein